MRAFVTVTASYILHGDSPDHGGIGVFGLEGSKPGASAVATLLSHRVIGLDTMGYGRIMAQCMTGAKMFYCMLTTMAEDTDNFVCAPMRPLPAGMPLSAAKKFMRTKIINKTYSELAHDETVFQFLTNVGPDALVNSFGVNIKGNTDNRQ